MGVVQCHFLEEEKSNIHVLSGGFVSHFFIPSKVTNCEKELFPHLATLNKVYESAPIRCHFWNANCAGLLQILWHRPSRYTCTSYDLPRKTRCPIAWRRLKTVWFSNCFDVSTNTARITVTMLKAIWHRPCVCSTRNDGNHPALQKRWWPRSTTKRQFWSGYCFEWGKVSVHQMDMKWTTRGNWASMELSKSRRCCDVTWHLTMGWANHCTPPTKQKTFI